jgi:hypothetical protein
MNSHHRKALPATAAQIAGWMRTPNWWAMRETMNTEKQDARQFFCFGLGSWMIKTKTGRGYRRQHDELLSGRWRTPMPLRGMNPERGLDVSGNSFDLCPRSSLDVDRRQWHETKSAVPQGQEWRDESYIWTFLEGLIRDEYGYFPITRYLSCTPWEILSWYQWDKTRHFSVSQKQSRSNTFWKKLQLYSMSMVFPVHRLMYFTSWMACSLAIYGKKSHLTGDIPGNHSISIWPAQYEGFPRIFDSMRKTECFIEAYHLTIYSLEKEIEYFNLNTTQHIRYFHQYIFAIGSSILEIPHRKSHDWLHSAFPG